MRRTSTTLLALCLLSGTASAEVLPPKVQALFFKKIFSYDRTIAARESVQVLVVEDHATATELVSAFKELGIQAKTVKAASIADAMAGSAAVYTMEASAAVKGECLKHKALSISGNAKLAEAGDVAVAVEKKPDGRAGIIVNITRAKAEAQDLAADLLGLATVVK